MFQDWMQELGKGGLPENSCVITSLPDWSEIKMLALTYQSRGLKSKSCIMLHTFLGKGCNVQGSGLGVFWKDAAQTV